MTLQETQRLVIEHANANFGRKTILRRTAKLAEEAGEVMKATNRLLERRGMPDDIAEELGDLFVTMLTVAESAGFDIEEVLEDGVKRFLAREWPMITPQDEYEDAWWLD